MYLNWLINASDFLAAILFIYGLKKMSSPLTARSGIVTAGIGMVIAVLVAFLYVFSVSPVAHAHLAVNIGLAVLALATGLGWAWLRGGTVAINAIHLDEIPRFSYDDLWLERSLRSVANFTRQDAREFLDLAGRVPLRTACDVFALEDANVALRRLKAGGIAGAAVLRRSPAADAPSPYK